MGYWLLDILAVIGLRLGLALLYLAGIGGIIAGFVLMDTNDEYESDWLGVTVMAVSVIGLAVLTRAPRDGD